MNVSLRMLRYVVAAADAGHVTEAARRLNVSQPSVSSAIAELEAETGVRLFVRQHARGIRLTAAGERVVNEARLLLKHAEDFAQSARELGESPAGDISIGCFLTLAVRFMPALLARFAQLHPKITVNLLEGDQDELLAMLVAGRIELMLAYSFAIPDEVAAEPLAELPPYAVLAADHRLAGRERVRLRELSQELFLLLDLPHSRDYFFGLFRSLGVEPRVVFRSRSQELIRGLAAHGHGFAIQNAIAGSTVTYDGTEVATVAFEEELPATRLMALRLRQHTMRPAVRAFAEFLSASFAPGGIFAPGSITAPQAAAPSARPQARSQRRQARR